MAEEMTEQTGHNSQGRNARKIREGIVSSDKMDKTIVVTVLRLKPHPLYGRIQRTSKKFKAHDANNECRIGDRVRIVETRPISKDKCWRLLEIVERAK